MDARELRSGNYTILQGKFCVIDGAYIKWLEDGSYVGHAPIPLTEEWLLKFGFEFIGIAALNTDKKLFKKGNIHISLCNGCIYLEHMGLDKFKYKYVHQLQNLYFALTGEELTIKI